MAKPPRSTKKKALCDDPSEVPEGMREKLANPISSIRRNLEFVGSRSEGVEVTPAIEMDQDGGEE